MQPKKQVQRKQAPPVTPSLIQQAGLPRSSSTSTAPSSNHKYTGDSEEPTMSALLAQSGIEQETLRAPPGIAAAAALAAGGSTITETQKVRYNEALDDIRQAMKWS